MQDVQSARGESPPYSPRALDDAWHCMTYESGRFAQLTWRGVPLVKNPLDLPIFAEIIHEVMPRVVIETGTRTGGSALYFADMMSIGGVPNPLVVTIDTEDNAERPHDDRICYLKGSSLDQDVADAVHHLTANRTPRMLVLDSDHASGHVLAELHAYSYLVTTGSYLIVEDTNVGGHPVESPQVTDGGPMEAVLPWLALNGDFEPDHMRERFVVGFNPNGWLRRA